MYKSPLKSKYDNLPSEERVKMRAMFKETGKSDFTFYADLKEKNLGTLPYDRLLWWASSMGFDSVEDLLKQAV